MAKPKARRQYGTGSIYFREKDKRWVGTLEAGWTATGTRRRIPVTAKTEADCRKKLKARAEEMLTGGTATASPRTTVKVWADEWLIRTQKHLRPKAWNADRSAVRQWIVPTLGHRKVSELTSGDIVRFKDVMAAAELAPSSMNRYHNVLNKMLKDAVIEGFRVHPGVTLVKKVPVGKSDRTAIPFPEALELLAQIDLEADPSRWVAMILNGIRQGERLGLTWPMVDYQNHEINISWQLQELNYKDNRNKHLGFRVPVGHESMHLVGRWHLTKPKTEAGDRVIPMTPWMEAAFRSWQAVAPESPYNLVWCEDDGMPIDPKTDREEWRRLQIQAGIAHPAGRPYDVHEGRHTTITMLKELGVEDETIEGIVGQSKLIKTYVHHNKKPRERAALVGLADRLALRA